MTTKYLLAEDQMPTKWYNLAPDLPSPCPPPLHPGTLQPAGPADMAPLFPMELLKQEMSMEQYIEIPEEVQNILKLWRPTTLYRAYRWEKALGTPAHIYYKYEGTSPAGSHKPNTAVPQAYYNKLEGCTKLTTETGAGQWGSALSMATAMFGMECLVYMVGISFRQKPYRKSMMQVWGGTCLSSPTDTTNAGRAMLAIDPESPGSLGLAISEAVEVAASRDDTHYALGSVLNHVMLHQTVIGEECLMQMEMAGEYPDVVIGCVGGGSNFAGISFPFIREKIKKGMKTQIIAVEPSACPTMTKGIYAYDFGDVAKLTPLLKMYTLGSHFIPPPIHAGGLRYHGMAPLVSAAYDQGLIEARAVHQTEVFANGISFARAEGILPAPESSHAIAVAAQCAEEARLSGDAKVILFNLSGHGHVDMAAYDNYLAGQLVDYEYPVEMVREAMAGMPKV